MRELTRLEPVWVFDVDGTIVDSFSGTSLRPGTIDLLRRLNDAGCRILLWSAGGAAYACERAAQHDIVDLFDGFYEKGPRDSSGRYMATFLESPLEATFVDDRPEDMPAGATVHAVAPYLVSDPFDRGWERARIA